jgi:hypothetical protein
VAITTNRDRPDDQPDAPRSARRREMVQGVLLLAALILLAILAKLPAA